MTDFRLAALVHAVNWNPGRRADTYSAFTGIGVMLVRELLKELETRGEVIRGKATKHKRHPVWTPVEGSRDRWPKVKACSRCREIKPLDRYHKNDASPNGTAPDCRTCRSRSRAKSWSPDYGTFRGPEERAIAAQEALDKMRTEAALARLREHREAVGA